MYLNEDFNDKKFMMFFLKGGISKFFQSEQNY